MQERSFARRANPRDLVERACGKPPFPACAVGTDRETVRLIAEPLHEVKRRIARGKPERLSPGDKKAFPSGVAVGSFGDSGNRNAADPHPGENALRRLELAPATID